jgi:hypothetical protein
VELGEPEPVGTLDHHHRRLGHVDADLDDGRPDEHVELAVAEPGHLGIAFGGLHPAVDHADAKRSEELAQPDELGLGGRCGLVEEAAARFLVARLGLVQSGLPRLRVASLQSKEHVALARRARDHAEALLDPAGRLRPDAAPLLNELEHGWLERVWQGDPASGA